MIFFLLILTALAAWAAWWLSGHDPGLSGENTRQDLVHRVALCAATVILLEILIFLPKDPGAIPIVLVIAAALFLIWHRCIGEFFAGCFVKLIDPEDKREFDPHENARVLDRVAGLLKRGQREEAVMLVEELKKSGNANIQTLETMLIRAGIEREDFRMPKPLVEASRLRAQGKFKEAETALLTLLAENPANVDAALMLIRLYTQDLRRNDKAAETLRWLQTQPHIPHAAVEYAIRSLNEWSQEKPKTAEADALPESVDELLAGGYLGTAIEILERKTREQPGDFDAWLKLAEAHAAHSGNVQRAKKIVQNIERNRAFTPEQVRLAKAKLEEWSAGEKAKG